MDIRKANASVLSSNVCLGADSVLQLLKNYCRNNGVRTSITVGIIGYPNVGKSSIINSLKRSRAVGVSSTAGFTRAIQVRCGDLLQYRKFKLIAIFHFLIVLVLFSTTTIVPTCYVTV